MNEVVKELIYMRRRNDNPNGAEGIVEDVSILTEFEKERIRLSGTACTELANSVTIEPNE